MGAIGEPKREIFIPVPPVPETVPSRDPTEPDPARVPEPAPERRVPEPVPAGA